MSVLQSIIDDLSPLLTGYTIQLFRWDDGNSTTEKVFVVRPSGGPSPDMSKSEPMFDLWLGGPDNQLKDNYDKINEIRDFIIQNSGLCNYRLKSDVSGPMVVSNGRHLYTLKIDAFIGGGMTT